jgi:hypothetical protein
MGEPRLLLVDADDLRELWDALLLHECGRAADPGSFSFEVTRRLRERVGDLLADAQDRAQRALVRGDSFGTK